MAKKLKLSGGISGSQLKEIRERAGLNQEDFYKPLGVKQSTGSRYETGRRVPKQIEMLLPLVYGNKQESDRQLQKLKSAR